MSQKTENSAAPLAEPQISKVRNPPSVTSQATCLNLSSSKYASKNLRFIFTFTNYCNTKTYNISLSKQLKNRCLFWPSVFWGLYEPNAIF